VKSPYTDDQFAALWFEHGCSPAAVTVATGLNRRTVYERADQIRAKGRDLPTISQNPGYLRPMWTYPRERRLDLADAVVMIASDLHMWPQSLQPRPPIQDVFLGLAHELKPTAIILNGDVIDATRISRHAQIRGMKTPTVTEEADALLAFCNELPAARHRHVTFGNHDIRVDNYLAAAANELADWSGKLSDRIGGWEWSYSVILNDDVEVRHDWHGGIHAAYNNVSRAGISFVTGHTHHLECKSYRDRRGVRYGIECGMLNDPLGPQWEWVHGRPTRWQAGFVVLTFDEEGRLLPPELCQWVDGRALFRGRALGKPRVRVKAGAGA
jgi:hypothetical protein